MPQPAKHLKDGHCSAGWWCGRYPQLLPRFGRDNEDSKYAPSCEGRAARFSSRRDACADCPGLASSPFEGSRTFGGAYPRNRQAAWFIREGSHPIHTARDTPVTRQIQRSGSIKSHAILRTSPPHPSLSCRYT